MYRIILPVVLALSFSTILPAQTGTPSTVAQIEASVKQRELHRNNTLFHSYPIRSVGPVVMSGRVTDIEVHPEDPSVFFIGYGSAGVFKSTNNGNTMMPVFDHQDGALGVGDMEISDANPDIIWVGTGEDNSSRSTYAGTGVYKSTDGGNSWMFAGLRNTQHIGKIVSHPTDPDIAWVGSLGSLYSTNPERGVYKTTDGGMNWEHVLFINDSTGIVDMIIHPEDPDVLWAVAWEKDRKAWEFKESGEGSGLYTSVDGGETWKKVTNGLPTGSHVGRMGIDISLSDPDIMYLVVDNQFETKTERETDKDALKQSDFMTMSDRQFMRLDNEKLNKYLRDNRFPRVYTAESVKKDIADNKYKPKALAQFLGEDANANLFDTEITGLEVYRTNDGGNSWFKTLEYPLDNVFFTYGYYFGEIRVDPNDPETVYTFGVPFIKSTDGGKTWAPMAENQSVHVDHHDLWIDPANSEHLFLGNDGGLYESHDGGENFIHHNVVAVGQFYTVNVDMEEPYNIYGGLQDNGTFKGPSTSTGNRERPWTRIGGGDGMHVAPRPDNSDVVIVGFQYGNYTRRDLESGESARITPTHTLGELPHRFNWNSPVNLSKHNPDVVYFGSQRLNRSFNMGDDWTSISPDLTHDLPNGDVPYSTLTTIAESPLDFNTIWVGSDDGRIQVTTSGGAEWNDVSSGLPEYLWVSEIHASAFDKATAYVSLNGYRWDDFTTYLYKTTDLGKTWTSVKGNLPDEVANVIIQDPVYPDILYAGLDFGSYVSFNDGNSWHYLTTMPNVASYDMIVHPRDLELVIATHGRSMYVMDVKPLHQVAERMDERITAIKPESVRYSNRWGYQPVQYRDAFMPEVTWMYFLSDDAKAQKVTVEVIHDGDTVHSMNTTGDQGFNAVTWDLVTGQTDKGPEFLQKGNYTLRFTTNKSTHEVAFEIN